ncbi:Inner membrane protein CreD-like protein [Candidatus Zixiibacteriota bacterium]|nr:Inner membrane protein CreD-like protein [candidate division Zixibacteria bacterium]
MLRESLILRIFLIIVVIIVLLIPLLMIQSLIKERQNYRATACDEVYKSWASYQMVAGPILTKESRTGFRDKDGNLIENLGYRHYLPDSLIISCELVPEIRHRGIYEVVLYNAKIQMKGSFISADFLDAQSKPGDTKDFYLSYNISDLRGISSDVALLWNGTPCDVSPGTRYYNIFKSGFYAPVKLTVNKDRYEFSADFLLKGSESIEFVPLGRKTDVITKSGWNNPGFFGAFLPASRSISGDGFTAEWKVNHFNRDYPQVWNQGYDVSSSAFGVRLLMPVDEYQKTMRTSKYGMMIILLTFVSFFMIEIFGKKSIHPIQYLLVGLSLVIFYALLLSISEYLLFQYSYLIASLMIIALDSLYIKSVYSNARWGALIGGILAVFYGFMYVILQLQDYALLLGNVALFLVLAIIMYLTRKLNWYEVFKSDSSVKK